MKAQLSVPGAAGGPSVDVIQHPKLIPVVIAAIAVVIVVWIGISLFRWRRIAWREHMQAQSPVTTTCAGCSTVNR